MSSSAALRRPDSLSKRGNCMTRKRYSSYSSTFGRWLWLATSSRSSRGTRTAPTAIGGRRGGARRCRSTAGAALRPTRGAARHGHPRPTPSERRTRGDVGGGETPSSVHLADSVRGGSLHSRERREDDGADRRGWGEHRKRGRR